METIKGIKKVLLFVCVAILIMLLACGGNDTIIVDQSEATPIRIGN